MATEQEQIDDLRGRLADVQKELDNRAKRSEVIDLSEDISAKQQEIDAKLESLEGCVRELLDNLMDARNDLSTHTH